MKLTANYVSVMIKLYDKNSGTGDDHNSIANALYLKRVIPLCLITSCVFPDYSQAAGSFGTTSGFYGELSQSGFTSMEDAAAWGWAYSNPASYPDKYSEGGVVYYKHSADGAPPAAGWTNYWWAYYTSWAPYGPYRYYAIAYYPDVIPVAKNFDPPCNMLVKNPIHIGIGEKYQVEKDYTETSGLNFTRYYHSSKFAPKGSFGLSWRHTYDRKISALNSGTYSFAYVTRADGKQFSYLLNATGIWESDADINDTLTRLADNTDNVTGWQLINGENRQIETYSTAGQLLSIVDPSGYTQMLTYSDDSTPAAVAPKAGLLIRVTDSFGRQLNFTYDANSRLSTLTDPAGGLYQYAYDADNNLSTVTYPDDTLTDATDNPKKTYVYGELDHTANVSQPHALTGIIDENNQRYATFTYDAQGLAISTEHAGGVDRSTLSYNTDSTGKLISATITDALGSVYTQHFQTVLGVVKNTGSDQPGGSGCSASSSALTYDANGNVASRTDFNGNRTNYSYDLTRNLETSRTEGLTAAGASTPATRTITTDWHPTFRLPVKYTEPGLETTYSYDDKGQVTLKSLKDLNTLQTRSWTMAYTYSTTSGLLLKKVEDGPRTDVSDVTTYDYYPEDATCTGGHFGCRGQLKQITDALGHITQISRYNAHSQPEELTDPNGLVTTLAYDARQRLTLLTVGGETTHYDYDPAGLLTRTTGPDGTYLAYSYDDAHRLTGVQDQLGNTVSYTLDALGNRTQEDVRDPTGQLARSQSRVYDALSRLQNLILPE